MQRLYNGEFSAYHLVQLLQIKREIMTWDKNAAVEKGSMAALFAYGRMRSGQARALITSPASRRPAAAGTKDTLPGTLRRPGGGASVQSWGGMGSSGE